jgi:hypothetical protein
MQHQLEINGRIMEYTLERKNVKNLNLRIRRDGSVYVSANKSVPQDYIENFLRSKADFISRAVEHYSEVVSQKESPKKYVDGESFRVFGHDLRLKVLLGAR